MDMYQEIILDHYRHPQNRGTIAGADVSAEDSNPVCGDVLIFQMKIAGGIIKDIKFGGNGCAISQASADMLAGMAKGMRLEDAARLSKDDILQALSIDISPARLKCALLCLKVMKIGLYGYMGKAADPDAE